MTPCAYCAWLGSAALVRRGGAYPAPMIPEDQIHTCIPQVSLGTNIKIATELAVLNCISYLILTIDYRATAQANILWSIISNATIALLTFTILKRIVEAKTKMECFGYIVGGTLGNVLGIYLTLWIFGK